MNLVSKIDETSSRLPPSSASEVKNLFKKHKLRPSRGLGQHFLIDKGIARKIVAAAELKPEDIVLEIGPGLGALTLGLAKRVKKVIAVEKDSRIVELLKETVKGFSNIKIVHGDILKIEPPTKILARGKIENFKVVANLPFYLTAPVIRKFLEATKGRSLEMTLVVQKEVAQRICAKPPDMNLLAVSIQFYAQPKIISYISKKSFWPSPEVDAAIIKIQSSKSNFQNINKDLFFKIVKAGFSQPRKQLINNLSKKLKIDKIKMEAWLWKNNIQPTQRAETLSVEDWLKLTKSFKIKQ